MLLHDLIRVEVPMASDRDRVLGPEGNGWVTLVDRATTDGKDAGRIRLGLRGDRSLVSKTLHVEFSPPVDRAADIVVGFTVTPVGMRPLFPSVSGELEMNPAGSGSTMLTIHGRYRPPLGAVGRLLDRSLARRAAQRALHSLIRQVASHLSSGSH